MNRVHSRWSYTAEESWSFSGEDHYSLNVADAGNFDEHGDHGLAVSAKTERIGIGLGSSLDI